MVESTTAKTAIVPRVSGGEEEHGHLEEFRTDPIGLMQRTRDECGDVGWFQLADKHVILLSGSRANEFFFRSADEDLDQADRLAQALHTLGRRPVVPRRYDDDGEVAQLAGPELGDQLVAAHAGHQHIDQKASFPAWTIASEEGLPIGE